MAAPTESVCFICDKAPCECNSKKTRRRVAQKPTVQSSPPQQAQPRKRVAKKTILGGSSKKEASGQERQEGTSPSGLIGEADGLSEDDASHLYAARLLAHMLGAKPMDQLKDFEEHILPTDLLPPEERIESWKRRLRGGNE